MNWLLQYFLHSMHSCPPPSWFLWFTAFYVSSHFVIKCCFIILVSLLLTFESLLAWLHAFQLVVWFVTALLHGFNLILKFFPLYTEYFEFKIIFTTKLYFTAWTTKPNYILHTKIKKKDFWNVEKMAFFGTERFLGYCGGFHHRILSFVITLDSLFIELSEEVTWVERRF